MDYLINTAAKEHIGSARSGGSGKLGTIGSQHIRLGDGDWASILCTTVHVALKVYSDRALLETVMT
jgi:hypothetical protein